MRILSINDSLHIPVSELTLAFSKSSGPGGQNINKTSTRVELSFDVINSNSLSDLQRERIVDRFSHRLHKTGVLTVVSDRYRSQGRNRSDSERKLIELLQEALKPPPPKRRKTKPGRNARKRRLDSKKRQAEKKISRRRPRI